ncbi:hypothetical protein BDA96_03G084600 [Sorghum bicolor]|uniref:Wall-associated receptor kinase galacturonan-binding domain-containing protein n=1 Tax=Sorghum bicolor TaxID=4558 RepID=A0A921UMP2_SORBI|nr:hypothetical protein BDA96_03G084600 [Sorghum bicolor]
MRAPAVLAVALALLLPPLLAAALEDGSCAPATCGNLSIRYPFWLRGQHPPYCGYPSLGIACDDPTGGAPPVLNGSYLRVLDIHYGNSSVVAFHTSLADDATGCRATRFNVSATLALSSQLAVSRANWELFLCSNCSRTPPAGSVPMNCTGHAAPWIVYLSRRGYDTGGPVRDTTSSAGCKYSAVPVLPGSPELRAMDDYARLVRRGFLMEWTVPGDCTACNASGGQCRHDDGGVDAFRCLCPDGRLQPATCARGDGEFTDPAIRYKALHN